MGVLYEPSTPYLFVLPNLVWRWLLEVVGCITFGPNFSPRKHLGNCTGTKIFSQGVACSSHTAPGGSGNHCSVFTFLGTERETAEGFHPNTPWGKFRSDKRKWHVFHGCSWHVDQRLKDKKGRKIHRSPIRVPESSQVVMISADLDNS